MIKALMELVERIMTELEQRQRVVDEALTWMGTPYHHMARVKGEGVDCGQLLAAVYEHAGLVPHIDPGSYPHDWHLHRDVERYLGQVQAYAAPTDTPKPGDIALFRFGRCISHGAIVVEWPRVLHSYVHLGVVLDDVSTNLDLGQRFAGAWTMWPAEVKA